MQISAQLQYMSILADRINDIKRKINLIIFTYESIHNNLDNEILGRDDISSLIREVDNNLNILAERTGNYSDVLSYACEEYSKSEEEIVRLYHLECGDYLNKLSSSYSIIKVQKIIDFNMIKNIKPCLLPKKEQITMSKVTKGVIEDGKNIIIRTWKK
ncbi:hypothetical protein SH1V18_10960 [Vallitalea longa]|uniref:Uncharacterized protein n=1 Tax=Vallitalea longa TaxID=2936439 RepID=A0A9W5Y9X5_9FIRM|nr:hypothetical protein [Vallitalea longa]GKX28616.1 hypothetical protein SH1V18_10960 [Vallitalea longa]